MPRQTLTEARPVAEATPVAGSPGRFLVQLITPGWGSSGYYSSEVLESAGERRVFAAGTHMYLDHPTESESFERPERSLRDLAAVLAEDARWDGGALVAEATVFGPYREVLEQMAESIGVSIRASAEVEQGEAEGRRGRIVSELVEGVSADFVTHAGRGGRIVDVLESARPTVVNRRAVAHGVAEATANELRERLQQVLRETYGGEESWVWVRDFDDTNVWYEHETPDESGTFQHAYTVADDGAVALSGAPVEVRAETNYVPVNPAGPTTTEEHDMPQIEEARLRELEEASGRVPTLETERDTAVQERDAARAALAERDRNDAARRIIGEAAAAAQVTFTPLEERGLLASLPTGEDGTLDEAAFRTSVDEAAASVAEAAGAGRVRGFGGDTGTPRGEDAAAVREASDKARATAFGRTVKEA